MRRGWCPSVYAPMPTGDGLLARVAPPMGVLTSQAARALAAASRDFCNGALGVTSRARLQVRGLTASGVGAFARAMEAAGLAHDDRTIVSPLVGCDPKVAADTHAVARDAAALAIGEVDAKYTIVVDGGGVLALDGVRANRRLRHAHGTWHEFSGVDHAPEETVIPPCVGLIRFANASHAAFGIAPAFGRLDAATLDSLAALSERFGDSTLRVTPWRSLVIANVSPADAVALSQAAIAAGLIVDPADARLGVAACTGKPGCASGEVKTFDAASELARRNIRAHVSGCAKGCAHPEAAPLTLVGRDGLFDVVVDGRASDPPTRTGLMLAEVFA